MSAVIPELKKFDEAELDRVFAQLESEVAAQAAALTTDAAIEAFRLEWLGRKQGRLGQLSASWLKNAPPGAKKSLGIRFNQLKSQIEAARTRRAPMLAQKKLQALTSPSPAPPGASVSNIHSYRPCRRSSASFSAWDTPSGSDQK